MNKQQSGFGVVVLLMAVVIVVLLGVTGWLVWDKMQTSSKNNAAATNSTPTNNSSQGSNSSNTQATNTNAAESLVTEFYGKYTVFGSDRVALIKQYGTASLLDEWNNAGSPSGAGSDPIECAQDTPQTATVTGHTANGAKIDVSVKEDFGEVSETLTVSVVDQSGLKIDHVTCPAR